MQHFLWFLIILFALMNLSKCPGCKKDFAKGVAIRVHQRTCIPLRSAANTIFLKREQNQKMEGEAKIPRYESLAPEELSDRRQDIRDEVNDTEELPHAGSSKVRICNLLNLTFFKQNISGNYQFIAIPRH